MATRKTYVKKSNTFFNNDSLLNQYLNEIANIPVLSIEEERVVAKAKDFQKLVMANLRFAVRAAHNFDHMGELSDLIQEANRGLMKAASSYDPDRMNENGRFINYAAIDILAALHTFVRKKNTQLSRDNYFLAARIANERLRFNCETGGEADAAYLADVLGVSVEKIENILYNTASTVYLDDAVCNDDDAITWGETISGGNDTDSYTRSADVNKMVKYAFNKYLNKKEVAVIRYSFGIGTQALSVDDIASAMHLTTTRCNQIKRKAIEKMKSCRELAELF